jgi:hypothetical protein
MSFGFLRAMLLTQKQVYLENSPSTKLTPPGYLKFLLGNSAPSIVSSSISNENGHVRDVVLKYRQRVPTGKSVTANDCTIEGNPMYKEATIPALSFRKYGFAISDDTISKYEDEASKTVNIGLPAPPNGIMMEFYNHLLEVANGLLGDINADLLTTQAAAFGTNVTTGLNTAKTINFPLSTQSNPLNQGLTLVMSDAMENEIRQGNMFVVGAGLINNVYLQKEFLLANTTDANWPMNLPKFYFDPAATSILGANKFGVFEKNAVQFLNINKFKAGFAGNKLTTFKFQLQLPLIDSLGGTEVQLFTFDCQLRYIDCAVTEQVGGEVDSEGDPVITRLESGWRIDLSANYGQFNIASDAYASGDRLVGNNGTLLYLATNA